MSQSTFASVAAASLQSFIQTTLQGESDAVLNKIARGEHLYSYAWYLCREDEDFSKATWDQHVGVALAAARAKRELTDCNARRWVYWYALASLGMDLEKLSAQSGSVLRALERLVEFVGVAEPGEGESLPDSMAVAPTFAWVDAKAEAVCRKIIDRKTPCTGEKAVELVNAAFPGRIKERVKPAADEVGEVVESESKASKSTTTVESSTVPAPSLSSPGAVVGLVRSYLADASDDDKRDCLVALTELLRGYAQQGKSAAKAPASSAGVGSVAPAALAAGAA